MKVLHISTYDIEGGAARAAYRLHQGLQSIGVDSQMLVQRKYSDEREVISPATQVGKGIALLKPKIDLLPLSFYRQRDRNLYSTQWLGDSILSQVNKINPDIINLHWICEGYLQIETIAKFNKPIVWTFHDMWAFTGGCHYNQQCDRYTKSCGSCPQLHSSRNGDISRWVWQRKVKAWKNLNLTIITPSKWLAKCTSDSSLFQNLPIEVIPYGLDTQKYKPIDKQLAKHLLGLPSDKFIILFGAVNATSDSRKGFQFLEPALQQLSQSKQQDRIELVIFGSSRPNNPPNFGFTTHYLGKLKDDISLSLLYGAADVFVAPSVQDNLPNTVMEALACGTPCVAFKIGGMPDMIEHQQNGYLAQPFAVEDLAEGISWVLQSQEWWHNLSKRAREKVEQEYALETQASAYLQVYNEILKRHD